MTRTVPSLETNRRDQELGGGGDGQNEALCGDRGGKLAASDGDRGQDHDRDNVGEKAVDEADVDFAGKFVG
jgi:hypothetical protein